MEKKTQNTAGDRNKNPAPQGSKWPDKTIIRYITRALVLLIMWWFMRQQGNSNRQMAEFSKARAREMSGSKNPVAF